MRALLSTVGSRGDVQPLVALALQLRSMGQEAHVCAPPDFRALVEGFGLPFTPIGPEVRRAGAAGSRPTTPPSPEERRKAMEAMVVDQFETITAAAAGCDVMVGATALQIAAPTVAERMGVPYVFAAYCPNVLPSPHHAPPPLISLGQTPAPPTADFQELWARDSARFHGTFGAALDAVRSSVGLEGVPEAQRHVFTDRPWLAADPALAPWPDPTDGAVLQTGAWMLRDDRALSPELESFLDAGEPPVYFGLGSMHAAEGVAGTMLEAARALGRRAVVSRGWADLSPQGEGADLIVIGEANLQALFPRVAAVVHHGGAGTTTTASRAGAPQVVLPHVYDQYYWAERVQYLDAGTAHPQGPPTVDSLTSALQAALRPEVGARARTLAKEMRDDGALTAATELIAMAG